MVEFSIWPSEPERYILKNKHVSAILNTWTLDAGIPLPFLPSPGRGGHVHTSREDFPAAAGWVADQSVQGRGGGEGRNWWQE